MPIIRVWCLPQVEEEELRQLHQDIVKAVVGINELGLKDENDMTCLFPPDMMKYGLGSEIIIEILGLFEKPERTPEVISSLAFQVGAAVSRRFKEAKIECFVFPFNPASGFWTCNSYDELRIID